MIWKEVRCSCTRLGKDRESGATRQETRTIKSLVKAYLAAPKQLRLAKEFFVKQRSGIAR